MKRKASQLVGLSMHDKRRVHQWMRSLEFAFTTVGIDSFIAATARHSSEAMAYLSRTWIPYEDLWAADTVKRVQSYRTSTTNCSEMENR